MPYDEARYLSHDTVNVTFPVNTQTFTASAVVLTSTIGQIPFAEAGFPVAAAVAITAAGTGANYVVALQNGSTVIATGAVANTNGSGSALTITTASSVVAAGTGVLNCLLIGTGTSSAAQVAPTIQWQVAIRKQFV